MQDLLTISRFAFLCNLSAKALRHYHEVDLLLPAFTDPHTGYRYYRPDQIGQAHQIRQWREVGLSLEDIRLMLQHPRQTQQVLLEHQRRLQVGLQDLHQALAKLQVLLQEDTMEYRTETLPDLQVLSIRTHLKVPEFEVIPRAFQDLMAYSTAQGYRSSHPNFFACYNQCEDGKNLVEMAVPLQGEVQGSGRMEVRTFPGGPAFVGRFVGPYERLGEAYPRVASEAARRGLKITGSTAEFYVRSVPDTPNPEEYQTDIAFFLEH